MKKFFTAFCITYTTSAIMLDADSEASNEMRGIHKLDLIELNQTIGTHELEEAETAQPLFSRLSVDNPELEDQDDWRPVPVVDRTLTFEELLMQDLGILESDSME